ncbi:MAG: hypothetical protein ACREBU_08445, partial [Nitrososphaera sp.]
AGFGGYGRYKSGYIGRGRDYMEPYRHPSKPPDDYDRRLRRELERIDTSGLSGRFEPTSYRIETQRNRELSNKEVDDLTQGILDRTIEEFKKNNQIESVPENVYEVIRDASREIGDRLWLVKNDPDDKTSVVEFVSEFLPMKDETIQQKEINQPQDATTEIENMAKNMDEGSKLANYGMPADAVSGVESKPALDNLSTDLYDSQDYTVLQKKRALSDYESEYDAI